MFTRPGIQNHGHRHSSGGGVDWGPGALGPGLPQWMQRACKGQVERNGIFHWETMEFPWENLQETMVFP